MRAHAQAQADGDDEVSPVPFTSKCNRTSLTQLYQMFQNNRFSKAPKIHKCSFDGYYYLVMLGRELARATRVTKTTE